MYSMRYDSRINPVNKITMILNSLKDKIDINDCKYYKREGYWNVFISLKIWRRLIIK